MFSVFYSKFNSNKAALYKACNKNKDGDVIASYFLNTFET